MSNCVGSDAKGVSGSKSNSFSIMIISYSEITVKIIKVQTIMIVMF